MMRKPVNNIDLRRAVKRCAAALLAAVWLPFLSGCTTALVLLHNSVPSPSPAASPAPTLHSVPTFAPTSTPSPSPSPSPTPSPTPEPTAVPEPTPTLEPIQTPAPTAEPEDDPAYAQALSILSGMSLREKVLQLFIVTPEQLTGIEGPATVCGTLTEVSLQENPVGGILYFAENFVNRKQTQKMIQKTKAASPLGLFIAVDEEGGDVARVADNPKMGTTVFPPMGFLDAPEDGYTVGKTIGSELMELGFNLDFAPVADVNSNPDNPVIGWRAFGEDAQTAALGVSSCVQGFRETGILCTLKHFPGHGDTKTDSHYGAAKSSKKLKSLRKCEFLPFIAGIEAGAPIVMVGHIALPKVTGNDVPASFSFEITTGLLRGELGFDGVIVTDSLDMAAITDRYDAEESAVGPLLAGADLLLVPKDFNASVSGVLNALENGTLSESRVDESVLRILRLKIQYGIIATEE